MGLSGHSLMAVRNIDAKGKLAICCDQWKIIPVTIVWGNLAAAHHVIVRVFYKGYETIYKF